MMTKFRVLFNRVFKRKELDLHIKRMGIDVEKQTAQIHMDHPVFVAFIQSCVDMFDNSGAINYLELEFFNVADMKNYTVTIKPENGLSPAVINSRLRHALEQIAARKVAAVGAASSALNDCGYKKPVTQDEIVYLRQYFPNVGWDE